MVAFSYLRVLGYFYEGGAVGERVNDEILIGGRLAPIHNKDATLYDFEFDNLTHSIAFGSRKPH